MTGRWTNQFQKDVAVEQRIFRGTYTVTNTTIEIGRPDIRQVQEHTFELFGHKNLKPRHLTSGLAVAAVGLTGYFLEKKFGLVSRVLGRGSVIFEVLYPASCSAEFEELVGKGVLENELKEMFNDLGKSLKELGLEDLIAELEDQDFERLTGIRLANFALCGQEIIDDLKKDGRSEGTTDIARSLGSSLEAIQNIEAIRRSDNGWVDINIEMQDTTDVVGYKVLIFPDKGKIREDYIKPDEPQKSDIITLKFLKKDLGYRFMVYLVYSDDTISMPLMTNHVAEQHQKQTAKHEAPAAITDLEISALESKRITEERVLIKWKLPRFSDTRKIIEERLKVREGTKIDGRFIMDEKLELSDTTEQRARIFLRRGCCYQIYVMVKYWDVNADCLRTLTKEGHWTTVPEAVDPATITWKCEDNVLQIEWSSAVGAKSYALELHDYKDNSLVGSNDVEICVCSWRLKSHQGNTLNFKITSKSEFGRSSESVMKTISFAIKTRGSLQYPSGDTEKRCIDTEKILNFRIENQIKENKFVFTGKLLSSKNWPEREIAIKKLGESEYENTVLTYGDGKSVIKRMVREARHLLELIHHPNVVQYIHSIEDGEQRMFILMELCHTETLGDRLRCLKDHEELKDSKYCKAVILHITQGIHHMHSKKIYHRDIKPSNILFSLDERVVKISDFGYSKKVNPATGEQSTTKSTGTDAFRPPETYEEKNKSQKTIDDRSDVFSLGLVYFMVLSKGKHPFGIDADYQKCNIKAKKNRLLKGLTGPDAALAKNLIKDMLNYVQAKRPNTTEILKHPYFWDTETITCFYTKVVDRISLCYNCSTTSTKPLVGAKDRSDVAEVSMKVYSESQPILLTASSTEMDEEIKIKDLNYSPCTLSQEFPLRNEIITREQKENLQESLETLRSKLFSDDATDEIVDKIILSAEALIKSYEEIGSRESREYESETKPVQQHQRSEKRSEKGDRENLIKAINTLTIKRRRNDNDLQTFKKSVEELKKLPTEDISNIRYQLSITAEQLVRNKKKGCNSTWKQCVRNEVDSHKEACMGCLCVKIFEEACTIESDEIFDLIWYIRSKLADFVQVKTSYDGNWTKYQEDILHFVAASVPELLPHMFKVMRNELKSYIEENKQQESSFYLPEIKKDHSYLPNTLDTKSTPKDYSHEYVDAKSGENLETFAPLCSDFVKNTSLLPNVDSSVVKVQPMSAHSDDTEYAGSNEGGNGRKTYNNNNIGQDVDLSYGHQPISDKFFTDYRDDATYLRHTDIPTTEASVADTIEPPMQAMTEYLELSAPSITSKAVIGPDGGRVTVGDCFIEFQRDTFPIPREILITGKIDGSEWPEGYDVITPTLHVNLGKICEPATVRLSTWALPSDDGTLPELQVLRFTDNKWEVLKKQIRFLESSRCFEFECQSFSRLAIAYVTWIFSSKRAFQNMLIIYGRYFITALYLDDKILKKHFIKMMKKRFNGNPDQTIPYNKLFLKINSEVEIGLRCCNPQAGVNFLPLEPFRVSIDRPMMSGTIRRRECVIESELPKQNFTIEVKVDRITNEQDKNELDKNTFMHNWRPEDTRDGGPEGGATSKYVQGRYTEQSRDHISITSGERATALHVTEGGTANIARTGGIDLTGQITPDLAEKVITASNTNKVKVAVMFSDYSLKFEGIYRLDQTIYDVIADIRKGNDKVTGIKHSKSKKEISMETKIETLLEEGWMGYLMATVKL